MTATPYDVSIGTPDPGCYGCQGTGTLKWAGIPKGIRCSCVSHSHDCEPDSCAPNCPSKGEDEFGFPQRCTCCGEGKPWHEGPGCIEILLPNERVAYVDEADAHLFQNHRWTAVAARHTHYLQSRMGAPALLWLHRVIVDAEAGEEVDHRNSNGLDNRRCNLRPCVRGQNATNQPKHHGASRFKGVSPTDNGKWQAHCAGSPRYLGRFDSEEDAARAYDAHASERFGEFARLNFSPFDTEVPEPIVVGRIDASGSAASRKPRAALPIVPVSRPSGASDGFGVFHFADVGRSVRAIDLLREWLASPFRVEGIPIDPHDGPEFATARDADEWLDQHDRVATVECAIEAHMEMISGRSL